MRKLFVASALLALLAGCQLLKKKDDADAAADAAAAAVVDTDAASATAAADAAPAAPTPAPVTAKNSADVARFPGESPVPDDDMKLASVGTARTSPKSGAIVATIKPGTDVTKVAEYQSSILVTFADPKDASSTLMGWIGTESFTAPVVKKVDGGVVVDAGVRDAAAPPAPVDAGAAKKELNCPANFVAVVLGDRTTCRKRCTKDTDCKDKKVGGCGPVATAAGSVAKVCVAGE